MKRALVAVCLCAALLGGVVAIAQSQPQEEALVMTGPGLDELRRFDAINAVQEAQTAAFGQAFRAGTAEGTRRKEAARIAAENARKAAAKPKPSRGVPRTPQVVQAVGDLLDRLASCESGMNPRAYNPKGPFYGAFQFLMSTWRNLGGTGDPRDHSYAEQKAIAAKIPVSSWHNQFPHCSRRIGV